MTNPIVRLVKWLFPSAWAAEPTDAKAGRRCAAGHWMDPSWVECPYCRALASAREKTAGLETRVEHAVNRASSQDDAPRRLAGVLVTFSWNSRGELFPLYEGKNVIGSGGAAGERPHCDVQITTDPTLSREHALIRCLKKDYEIFDQKSQNGTYMNDRLVPVHGMPLEDQATIKAGETVWQFLMIRPPAHEEKRPPRSEPAPAERVHAATPDAERRPRSFVYTEDSPATPAEDSPATPAEGVDESVEPPARQDRHGDARPPVSEQPDAPPKRHKDKTSFPGSDEPPPGTPRDKRTKLY